MSTLPKLVIVGAGGFGRELLGWAEQSVQIGREWEIKGFIDDNPDALKGKGTRAPVIGRIADYQPREEDTFLCGIGLPAVKRRVSELIMSRGGRLSRLYHRSAVLGPECSIGDGVTLCPFAVVTANACLGRGVTVNLHSTVDHDAVVGDWTQINCHCDVTGGANVGQEVWFSSHVSIAPGVRIGDRAYLGMGAMILRDVEAGSTVTGSPARRIG